MAKLGYLAVNAVLILGSLALAGRGSAAAAILVTLGLAYPLTYLPTALVYVNAAAMPLLFLKGPAAVRIGSAGLLCLAIALAPGTWSRIGEGRIRSRIARETVVDPIGGSARHIELRYDIDPNDPRLEEDVCGRV